MARPRITLDLLVFASAAGVAAVHTIVDAFAAPERGTIWSDHLVPGVTTLGALAAAVLAYAFACAGLRAALALMLGVLAIEGGAIAIAESRSYGPRAEHVTAFLLVPAGLALLVLAVALLWRSRRGGRLRWPRRGGRALLAVVAVYVLVVPLAMALYATHRPRSTVAAPELGRPYRAVTVPTADGLRLAAWYVPSRNGAAVVSFPTRRGKVPQARMLARHGYGVLLLDMRGYDGSDGTSNAFGWGAWRDVDAAVAWLAQRPEVKDGRIGGIGFSVGGEMMIEAAARNPALRAVVSEGAGERSVRETLIRGPRGWPAVPSMVVETAALAVLSGTPPPESLERLVARIAPRPVLLVYGSKGLDGEQLNESFFRAAGRPKELWRVPAAGHVGGYDADPKGYERRVVGFFDRALLRGGGGAEPGL